MIISDFHVNEEDIKIMKDIMKRQKVYKFLKDRTNKSMLVSLFTLCLYFVLCIVINNLALRIASYFAIYYLFNYFYDKFVDYLFRDICK